MRRPLVLFLLLATLPLFAACKSGQAASGSGRNPNVIGSWELDDLTEYNALEAVRLLRPNWLRTRVRPSVAAGNQSPYPVVHLDGVPLPNIQDLEQIRADDVVEMRYMSGPDASTRWGTGYANGAILVDTQG